ncbi:redox-sensitive transcriptional activator SoxR [Massilia sp. W12]|uniref:redox-sensitive transcriptional activator SoxR n=1 Tax=Massilia sp. W12 TaxID=3126507 RepID=UPI0030CD5C08
MSAMPNRKTAQPETGASPAADHPSGPNLMPISEVARRSGLAASALRYYEEQGLLHSSRSSGGQRLYKRESLRRIAFIRAAQQAGLNLEQIRAAFASLPQQRTPTPEDWRQLAASWQPLIQQRIDALIALRDRFDSCIGCGCLSLTKCALYNPQDQAAQEGSGARYLLKKW